MPTTTTTERIPLANEGGPRPYYVQDPVEFYSRQRRKRLERRCFGYVLIVAIFTMALIVTISYSVSHDTIDAIDHLPNLTSPELQMRPNQTGPLRLTFVPGSGSYTLFTGLSNGPAASSRSVIVPTANRNIPGSGLTDKEFREGLEAGRLAIDNRLLADTAALANPIPALSPESRHRYATSTCSSVGNLALAATAEIAATKRIEKNRMNLGEPSAFGSFFGGSWLAESMCKQLVQLNCTVGKYRSYDGTCNRPMQWGAAMTPYRRDLPPDYADGIEAPRRATSGKDLPSARQVSLKVHKPSPSSNPSFTVMLAVYGQFLDHDVTATAISQGVNGTSISCCPPTTDHPECYPVVVGSGDPVFDLAGKTCMNFVRSAPAPQCIIGPRQQLNQVTAFIDASSVYGSDVNTANELREFAGGRLKMQRTPDNRTLLPPSTNPNDGCNREAERLRGRYCFAAGDARANENLHLTTMHLIWARQHNRVVDELARVNPHWDDETLYQEARRILGAQMQHITYDEFLPIILGEQEINMRDLRPLKQGHRSWPGSADDTVNDPSIANNFAAAAFRFAHTLLPGLMMVTDAQRGTSSYVELHKMLFNPYSLYGEDGVKSSVTSATENVIQMTSTHVTSQLTNHLFEDPIGNSSVPCGLDLVSLNIQRGRDHGLPGYTRWREYCGLGRTNNFGELGGHLDPDVLQEISMLYESVQDVDLYTGALAEIPRSGALVGPTFVCLIAAQFTRLQRGDRFWYEVPSQPYSFTEDQLQEIRKTSLSRMICDCSDGVTQIQPQVMRSIGPHNPMMSCEDLPRLSLEPWRDTSSLDTPVLSSPYVPINWLDLKKNINNTIQDVLNFINSTASSTASDTTDWAAFRNYINNTFSDLRNQLAGLYPAKPMETLNSGDDYSATVNQQIYEDWVNFKIDLIKSLNRSVSSIGGGPDRAGDWIAFRQNIQDQFTDLKNQIDAVKAELGPRLLLERYKQEQAELTENEKITEALASPNPRVMIPAIFDWKNFKDSIIRTVDEAIMNLGGNMPPPGDPAWETFGTEIMKRFAELRDRINSQTAITQTPPMELAVDSDMAMASTTPALTLSDKIHRSVSVAMQKMKELQEVEGAPWANIKEQIMKGLKMMKHTSAQTTKAPTTQETIPQPEIVQAVVLEQFANNEVTNLTADWLNFRKQINESLSRVIEDVRSKRPKTMDPTAWAAFSALARTEFSQLRDELANIRAEWQAEVARWRTPVNSADPPLLKASFQGSSNPKFDYTVFLKPVIPQDDWSEFKRQINDTLNDFLDTARNTEEVDLSAVNEAFNKSFNDLRNDIASLRELVTNGTTRGGGSTSSFDQSDLDWANFRARLNSTVNDLIRSLRNETEATMANMMRILFETKDRLSDLEPPPSAKPAGSADWLEYANGINKTVADTLARAMMLRADEPGGSSSSGKLDFPVHWLLFTSVLNLLAPMFQRKI